MRRLCTALALLGAIALGACGKYGPPRRLERTAPVPAATQPAPPAAAAPGMAPAETPSTTPDQEPQPEPEPGHEEQRR